MHSSYFISIHSLTLLAVLWLWISAGRGFERLETVSLLEKSQNYSFADRPQIGGQVNGADRDTWSVDLLSEVTPMMHQPRSSIPVACLYLQLPSLSRNYISDRLPQCAQFADRLCSLSRLLTIAVRMQPDQYQIFRRSPHFAMLTCLSKPHHDSG